MNKDQIKGTIKEGVGKAQESLGKVTGSTAQKIKGVTKELDGKAQKKFGDIKERIKDEDEEARRDR